MFAERRLPLERARCSQSRWRKVNAPELVALVRAGVFFNEGVLLENDDTNQEAAA